MVDQPDIEVTDNGIIRSRQFDDIYYSTESGIDETRHVFLDGNNLPGRWRDRGQFIIGETGFGSGLNFLTTWQLFDQTTGSDQRLHFISVERYPLTRDQLSTALNHWRGAIDGNKIDRLIKRYPPRLPGFHTIDLTDGVSLTLFFGDAVYGLKQIGKCLIDAWFLDGFTPAKNPSIWTDELYEQLARLSRPTTTLASFTAAGDVRRGLQSVGFDIQKCPGFGKKRDMITGKYACDARYAMPKPPDHVLVTGAGLAGSAAARQLAKNGVMVTVIDRADQIAAGASGNPIALINPKLTAKPTITSDFYTAGYSHVLGECTKYDDIGFDHTGSLNLQVSSDKKRRFDGYLNNLGWPDDHMRKLDAGRVGDKFGHPVDMPALYYPDAGMVDPEKLVAGRLNHPNITVKLSNQLTGLDQIGEKWLVSVNGARFGQFSHVVLCHGWPIRDLDPAGWLPLRTSRGQLTMVMATEGSRDIKIPISYGGYLIPAVDGRHILGATYTDGLDTDTTDADHAENIERLRSALPDLAAALSDQIIDGRASIRTTVKDRFPIIGQLPDPTVWPGVEGYFPGLFTLIGLGSHGVIGSSIGGRVIGHLITGSPPPLPRNIIDHLNPSRFLYRQR